VTVEVLLATFQGEAWLPEQIASILAQDYPNTRILTRDDGSTDKTVDLLAHAAAEYPERMRVLDMDVRTGSAAGNFVRLLRASSASYVAFADQEDVWFSSKLSHSMERMRALEQKHSPGAPLLVFSDLTVVDAQLEPLAASLWRNNRIDPATVRQLGRLLGENVVTGCTALMNRPMVELAKRMPVEGSSAQTAGSDVLMHDHWIALLACTLGHADWLGESTVAYRQHGRNVVGAARLDASVGGRLGRVFGREAYADRALSRGLLQAQARAFLQCYEKELGERNRRTLLAFGTLDRRFRLDRVVGMVRHGFWRSTVERNVMTLLDLLR